MGRQGDSASGRTGSRQAGATSPPRIALAEASGATGADRLLKDGDRVTGCFAYSREHGRFVAFYLLCGLAAAAAQVYADPRPKEYFDRFHDRSRTKRPDAMYEIVKILRSEEHTSESSH